MTDERSPIRIHVLHCGSMLVSKAVPYGGGVNLKNARRGVFDKVADRVELPVSAYLIEHPKGKVLIDTGWSREISPEGVYDAAAVKRQLPGYLAAFYHPWVEKGKTVAEQLAAMGIAPEDLSAVVLTHLDADHTSGLRSVKNAQRILLPRKRAGGQSARCIGCVSPKACTEVFRSSISGSRVRWTAHCGGRTIYSVTRR